MGGTNRVCLSFTLLFLEFDLNKLELTPIAVTPIGRHTDNPSRVNEFRTGRLPFRIGPYDILWAA